ncbi:MAG: hypothetical protein F6K24_27115 [Okeania sp. SIO2D1]|nr:hypothetical protein [Okeania sp. SIO2D1]
MKKLVVFHSVEIDSKDAIAGKTSIYVLELHKMKISLVLLLGKVPEYFIVSD